MLRRTTDFQKLRVETSGSEKMKGLISLWFRVTRLGNFCLLGNFWNLTVIFLYPKEVSTYFGYFLLSQNFYIFIGINIQNMVYCRNFKDSKVV
jgi:hypothetical protein